MEDLEVSLRRRSDTLYVSGSAMIIFGLWSVIRFTLSLTTHDAVVTEQLEQNYDPAAIADKQVYYFLVYVLSYGLLGMDMLLRLLVGLGARREGKGRKSGMGYAVLSVFMLLWEFWQLLLVILNIFEGRAYVMDVVITPVVQFSCLLCAAELSWNAVKVKLIKRRLKKEVRDAA
ncbi:MAG: hypothetical protein J6F31_07295 [Oscillospiraceae bacterium]|nr:hypothetical protein [Oscillospiraceae bacterium]